MKVKNYISALVKTSPSLILIFLAIIWGSSFILIKKGLVAFSPGQVGTLRVVFAFLILSPIAFKHFKTHFKKHWKEMLALGLLSNLIPAILFSAAEVGLSSSLAGILNALTPIMTMIIGALFFTTAVRGNQILGITVGFIGSLMISFVGNGGELGTFNFYALFVIIATICYGISANMVKKFFSGMSANVFSSLAFFSITPIALIYLVSTDFILILTTHPDAFSSLFYIFILGTIGTALALLLFYRIIQNTNAVFATTVTYLIPIVAVLWGFVDGENLYPLHFVGMLLIIVGVYFSNKHK
ncbi:MAG: DMT family transporter [Melioribacteraceae bacterium]|nr:DMT family transporter [Melioribacteraceae bacterium]MCF8264737.1 DMT family transporter [Melioribacteraceae bacterium]MCF8413309.1 DMT family transporter [Melioribacteraceae bacterium]